MDGYWSSRNPNGNGSGVVGGRQIYATGSGSPDPTTPGARRSSAAAKPWGSSDAEMKRKKRIASYKMYTVEGKVKETFKKGLRWIKNKCSQIVHGY